MKTIKQIKIKTSNKILILFFVITFAFSYTSLFISLKKYDIAQNYTEQLSEQLGKTNIKTVHFKGEYNPNGTVLSTQNRYLKLEFSPSPKTIYIESDTLYISTSKPFTINLPDLEYFIIDGEIHHVFAPPAPIEKLHEYKQ